MAKWNARRVKRLRAGYGESQTVFARRLNMTVGGYRDWEYGRNPITGTAVRLLDILDDALKEGKPLPHPDAEDLVCAR